MENKPNLQGRGESTTFGLFIKILWHGCRDNVFLYIISAAIAFWAASRCNMLITQRTLQILNPVEQLLSPVIQLALFIPPFVFVIIGVFPAFSQGLKSKLKSNSKESGIPLVQVMLNHFALVMITSLGLLLCGLALQSFCVLNKANPKLGFGHSLNNTCFSIVTGFAILFLIVTLVEVLRCVRTMYILILADYFQPESISKSCCCECKKLSLPE